MADFEKKDWGNGSVNADSSTPLIDSGNRPFVLIDPSRPVFRFTILFFVCFLTFGSYFCYDNPGALQTPIEKAFGIDSFKYEVLYSVYSWPNTVQVFFGGWLIDRFFGLPKGALFFCALVFLGQIIFAVGCTIQNTVGYAVAVMGRFVFGLGGESLSVAQSAYSAKWFRNKEIALAFGIALSFSRIGSAVNFNLEPWVDSQFGLPTAIWLGAVICLVSVGSAVVLAILDTIGSRYDRANNIIKVEEPVSLLDVRFFPITLWLIFGICVTFYVSVFVWIQIASKYLQQYWGLDKDYAGRLVSIPYLMSAVVSPLMGFIVDRIGRSTIWIIAACALMVLVHLSLVLFPFNHITPIPALVLQGVSYSVLAATLWPSVPLIVEQKRVGTAFGLMTALQNAGLAIAPLLVGFITSKYGYKPAIYIFAGCAFAAFVMGVLLVMFDLGSGGILSASGSRLRELAALRKQDDENNTTREIQPGQERSVNG